jgi:protein SCO1/2
MFALFTALASLLACTIPAGDPHPVEGVVLATDGSSVTLNHGGVPEVLPAGTDAFVSDPNLSRTVKPGDVVQAFLMVTPEATRVIGFEVTGHHDPSEEGRPLGIGEVHPGVLVPSTNGPVTVGEGAGRVQVVTFLFTRCPKAMYCPLLMRKLYQMQGDIKGHADIVAVTLDPANDSLVALQDYGEKRMADPEVISFGRVELDELQELLIFAGASRDEAGGSIDHNLRLLVLDSQGRLVYRHKDNNWDVPELTKLILETK